MAEESNIFQNELVWVEGFPLQVFGPTEQLAKEVFAMTPRKGDVFLSTYPKCGTTWTQFVIWGILHNGAEPPNTNIMMFKKFPFLELLGTKVADSLPSPRTMKVHLPYRLTPKSSDARYVVVMRNPFDCCVSYYHQMSEMEAKPMGKIYPFDNYIRDFSTGILPFGDYFEHVQSWYEHREDSNVLFLSYEDMKRDIKSSVLTIAQFLGPEHRRKLGDDPQMLDNVIKHSSFDYLKENAPFRIISGPGLMERLNENYDSFAEDMTDESKMKDDSLFQTVNFFRKGQVGSGREELTKEHWALIDRLIDEKIKYPELRDMMRKTKV